MIKPKVGICTVTMQGFNLDEDDSISYQKDLVTAVKKMDFEVSVAKKFITSETVAEEISDLFNSEDIDLYILLFGTFSDDRRVMPLLTGVNKPVIIWATDINPFNVSIVGTQNVIPNIYDLGLDYKFIYGKFDDRIALNDLYKYSRACAVKNKLKKLRIGYIGGHPSIMTSLTIDELAVRELFGISLVNFGNDELLIGSKGINKEEAKKVWEQIKEFAGEVDASEDMGIISSSMFIHILKIIKDNSLDAITINCYPHLKGQVCISIARLMDLGIPSACEGDLDSTILMYILYKLSGKAVSNGDLLKIYKLDKNDNFGMFSHCGAGAFSLAADKKDIKIHTDYETGTGIAVYFPEKIPGEVTVTNMIGSSYGYKMFIAKGRALDTSTTENYMGNPINVQFDFNIRDMLKRIAERGFGHHWNIGYGDNTAELTHFCELLNIDYELMV